MLSLYTLRGPPNPVHLVADTNCAPRGLGSDTGSLWPTYTSTITLHTGVFRLQYAHSSQPRALSFFLLALLYPAGFDMLKVLHKCLLIECNQIAELRQTGVWQPVCPFPWTQQWKRREALTCHRRPSTSPSEGSIDSAVCFARKLSPLGQPIQCQREMETRKEQSASSWAINRAARACPGLGEAPCLSGGMVLELRGLGGYSGILPTHLPLICTAESTQAA